MSEPHKDNARYGPSGFPGQTLHHGPLLADNSHYESTLQRLGREADEAHERYVAASVKSAQANRAMSGLGQSFYLISAGLSIASLLLALVLFLLHTVGLRQLQGSSGYAFALVVLLGWTFCFGLYPIVAEIMGLGWKRINKG